MAEFPRYSAFNSRFPILWILNSRFPILYILMYIKMKINKIGIYIHIYIHIYMYIYIYIYKYMYLHIIYIYIYICISKKVYVPGVLNDARIHFSALTPTIILEVFVKNIIWGYSQRSSSGCSRDPLPGVRKEQLNK